MAKANDRSAKDKQMASHLKKMGVKRDSGRCVICGKIVKNIETLNHIRAHSFQG